MLNFSGLSIGKSLIPNMYNAYVLFDDLSEYALAVDLTLEEAVQMFDIFWEGIKNNPAAISGISEWVFFRIYWPSLNNSQWD